MPEARHLLDLHCHTREHSYDATLPAAELVRASFERGFAGMVLTDHNYCWSPAELAELRTAAGLADSFVLLSGQEVKTAVDGITWGDLLLFGHGEPVPDGTSPHEVRRLAAEAGGFVIAPHVAAPRVGFGDHVFDCRIDAVETWNGRYGRGSEARGLAIAAEAGLPATGGSDAHHARDVAGGGTLFDVLPRTLEDIRRMLQAGACAPWQPSLMQRLRWR